MKPSELKISISFESYDEKTAQIYRNYYVDEKRIVSTKIRVAQIKDLVKIMLKFDVPIFYSLIEISRETALR